MTPTSTPASSPGGPRMRRGRRTTRGSTCPAGRSTGCWASGGTLSAIAESARIEHAWPVHQAETTVDFARRSRVVAWLLGGLNFQIEHHLFPRISHVNYPAISRLVEETCRDFGIKYAEHRSLRAGVASHF